MAIGPKEVLPNRKQEFADLLEKEIDIELAELESGERSKLKRFGKIGLHIESNIIKNEEFGDEADVFFLDKKTQELVRSKYVNSKVGWHSMSFKKGDNFYNITLGARTQTKKKKVKQ